MHRPFFTSPKKTLQYVPAGRPVCSFWLRVVDCLLIAKKAFLPLEKANWLSPWNLLITGASAKVNHAVGIVASQMSLKFRLHITFRFAFVANWNNCEFSHKIPNRTFVFLVSFVFHQTGWQFDIRWQSFGDCIAMVPLQSWFSSSISKKADSAKQKSFISNCQVVSQALFATCDWWWCSTNDQVFLKQLLNSLRRPTSNFLKRSLKLGSQFTEG